MKTSTCGPANPILEAFRGIESGVGCVKVSCLFGGLELTLQKCSDYEVLVSCTRDIHVRVTMEGTIEL